MRSSSCAFAVLAAACNGAGTTPAGTLRGDAGPAAASAASSASARARLAPLPDGCWSGVDLEAGPRALVDAVGSRCTAGMEPVLPGVHTARLTAGQSDEVAIAVEDPRRCLRAVAVGDPGTTELELRLVDAAGVSLGADDLTGTVALVTPKGPTCVRDAGAYRLIVRARRAGEVALQVWRAK